MKRIVVNELHHANQNTQFENVKGGTDALRLLAQVSHLQAESSSQSLEDVAESQSRRIMQRR